MLKGVPSETRDFCFGPDGRFYVGEYMGTKAAAVDLKTREIELFHMAQPEGITVLGDKMYFGNYTQAELYILDTTKPYYPVSKPNDPNNNPRIWGIYLWNVTRLKGIFEGKGIDIALLVLCLESL